MPESCARTRCPISTARTSPRTSATSSSTSPRCSTRRCTSWRRGRSRSMRDLDGKTVVVDLPDSSSTFVTAINVFDRLGIRPHLIYQEPRLAVDMLRKGEVDAIVAIEGKPSAMAEPDQGPQPASGAGRIRQAAAGGVSAVQAYARRTTRTWWRMAATVETISPPRPCWRRTTGRRTATAIAASLCWSNRFSPGCRSCRSRRSIRNGKSCRRE